MKSFWAEVFVGGEKICGNHLNKFAKPLNAAVFCKD